MSAAWQASTDLHAHCWGQWAAWPQLNSHSPVIHAHGSFV